jgi:hypothetical protein
MMSTNRSGILAVSLLLFIPFIFQGCGSDGGSPVTSDGDTVGPAGGTVTDSGGASADIPAGALDAETAITVKTLPGKEDLPPESQPFLPMLGGARFGPSGMEFNIPVTLTIPVDPPVYASDTITVLYWDDLEERWTALPGPVTVLPGGGAVTVETTHFTLFSAISNVFDNFHENFGDGSTAQAAFDAYVSWFLSNVTWMGRKGLYNGDCHEVVGIKIDLGYRVEHLPDGPYYEGYPGYSDGESRQPDVIFYVSYDYVEEGPSGTIDKFYALEIHVSLKCCAADVNVTAQPSSINIKETSSVTATVMCDDEAMAGYGVTFEALGGLGEVSPATAATSAGGTASTTFTAGEDEGVESVRASITQCAGQESPDGAAQIEISSDWRGTMDITFTHDIGDEPLYYFTDHVSISLDLTIEEGVVYGTGTGSHSITLTPAGNCTEQGMVAPAFSVVAAGTVEGDDLLLQVVPMSMPLSFTLHCVWDTDDEDFPFPVYGMLEGSIMGQYIFVDLPWEKGATDSGSGIDPAGGDIPMAYSWTFTLGGS